MNEVIQQLYDRKSVRAYQDREIEEPIVQEILKAAVMAPTAGNQQLYTILRISDPDILNQLSVSCDNQPFIAKGKLVLLFLADCLKWYDAFSYAGCKPRKPRAGDLMLAVNDALIAAQNAVTAAWSYGIGSCYIGDIMENYEIHRELLHLPDYVFPAALLIFGYPTPQQSDRPKPDRVDMEYIVQDNYYQRMTEQEIKAMFQGKAGGAGKSEGPEGSKGVTGENQAYIKWIRAFCKRKYNSDFSKEMQRSVKKYLEQYESM